jgi:hypothetical protein
MIGRRNLLLKLFMCGFDCGSRFGKERGLIAGQGLTKRKKQKQEKEKTGHNHMLLVH